MVMFVVVPGEECSRPRPRCVNGGETVRIIGTIFHGLELRLAEGIVVGGMRAAVALGDAQIEQQLAQRLALHRTAIVGVQGELVRLNALLASGFSNELFCQIAAFFFSDHPTDHIAAEDVQHGVERILLQFAGSAQPGDVP